MKNFKVKINVNKIPEDSIDEACQEIEYFVNSLGMDCEFGVIEPDED